MKKKQERKEKEKREKKKLAEKKRIERLKQEGKFMTKEQKEQKQRTLLQLQAMGARIPFTATPTNVEDATSAETAAPLQPGATKPKYERIRKKQSNAGDQAGNANQTAEEKAAENAENNRVEDKESVKESWDASSNDEESVKDEWDAESDKSDKTKSLKKSKATSVTSGVSYMTNSHSESSGLRKVSGNNNNKNHNHSEGDESEDEEFSGEETESESEESDHEDRDLPPIQRVKLRLQVS